MGDSLILGHFKLCEAQVGSMDEDQTGLNHKIRRIYREFSLNHWLDSSSATCLNAKFQVNGKPTRPCCCTKMETSTTLAILY
ncbi:hypothetical protein DICVIV_09532 [Dictyocaulus viviparus]|uniref:Uncharacterized protein n=1 Tax=Dictyocaulus viviparus TaxID=29172 RepID=A0A0D8XIL3_DICVI|nr:hypothetical protein DICVIV_09532 [Dictyocaulus viviparus]